jgi:hypothetical protein
VISAILIEALARRAMVVVAHTEAPTVPVFRAAFTDELKRFDNSNVHPPASVTAHIGATRARLVPDASTEQRSLGQTTGGTAESDAEEARSILKMICTCSKSDCADALTCHDLAFIAEQVDRSNDTVTHYRVSGKQLFYLRDLKSKLIDRGIL